MTRDAPLTYDGITQLIFEWALDYGVPPELIMRRLRGGIAAALAITKPMKTKPGHQLPKKLLRGS